MASMSRTKCRRADVAIGHEALFADKRRPSYAQAK